MAVLGCGAAKNGSWLVPPSMQAGEELLISYIDLELPRSARRAHLLKYFHFECGCPRWGDAAAPGAAGEASLSFPALSCVQSTLAAGLLCWPTALPRLHLAAPAGVRLVACHRCEREAAEGSARCSYQLSKGKTSAPKRRGRKARVSR